MIHFLSDVKGTLPSRDKILHSKVFLQFQNYGVVTNKTNSVALRPQANYTDWATATCRRNLVPTSVDRGVSHGQCGGSHTVINLSILHRSRYFSFKLLLIYPHKGWVDPIPDPLLLRKPGSAGNRTQELWPLDHRDGFQIGNSHF
jgi:hypothetical protein